MRINVYAEEITDECEFITKEVDGRRFYGVRMYLKSASELHHSANDDDRSAITFWVPWRNGKNHHDELADVIKALSRSAVRAWADDEAKLRETA